jgi:glycosyltransferase involved in cell wall biosynthesis
MKDELPRITIVTPNYNMGDYIETTILSVLNQQYPNLEYIIIDGGSNDDSLERIKKYSDRLSYWISEKDNGLYDALNKGFARSTGEIMGWINSDDKLHPNCLFTIAGYFKKNTHVSWIQGYPTVIDINDNIIFRRDPVFNFSFFYSKIFLLNGKYIQQESTFWRRELWNTAGGKLSTEYKLAGDFELWMRFFQYSKLYCIKEEIGAFRKRETQLSSNSQEYQKEACEVIDKVKASMKFHQNLVMNLRIILGELIKKIMPYKIKRINYL